MALGHRCLECGYLGPEVDQCPNCDKGEGELVTARLENSVLGGIRVGDFPPFVEGASKFSFITGVRPDTTFPQSPPAIISIPGEVRTTSETGGQKGVKPERMSLLPYPALAEIARVYGFGEKKYSAHNWRLGYEWDKSIDAVYRHFGAFVEGEDNDPESGLSHLAHAAFHIFTLLVFKLNPLKYGRFDNRHKES